MTYNRRTLPGLVTVAALLLFGVPARAWNDLGHETIALIAYGRLTAVAKGRVDAILIGDPLHRDLLTLATWPDKHRTHPAWHYVNIPLQPGAPRGRTPAGDNVLEAIRLADIFLSNPPSLEGQADALGNMVHFVGDVHQPLHTVARFTEQTPNGDRGGNDVLLRGKWRNIHALWDNALNLGAAKPDPRALAGELAREYPPSHFLRELTVTDPAAWAQEGCGLAVSRVYTLDETGPVRPLPSRQYLDAAERTARERVTLAGYRLAAKLNTTLEDPARRAPRTDMTTVPDPAPEATVYATRTGRKYHRAGCSGLARSQIPMTLQEARARGLTPCGMCRP